MSTPSPVELPRSFEDLRGRVFQGRYAVTELLTVGHSHVVFAATDRKGAGQVLLRVMRPSLLHDPPTVARFEQRVQSARRASSLRARPSIDAGVGKDGKLYLVCKRPPGRSIQQHVTSHEHGRLPWPVAKQVLQSLVEVLAAAHDRRIVHGGMTPDSFWIEEPEGAGPVAYVVDLGANPEVRLEDEAAEPVRTTALTADMEFTAPETIIHATYDPRTDVYLLGLLAYFMLAGRPPFSGKNQFQVATLQLQHAVPSLRAMVPVPEGVEALIGRMLAKEPAERLQTMGEVGRALMGVSEVMTGARGHAVAPSMRPAVPVVAPVPSWPSPKGIVASMGRAAVVQPVAPSVVPAPTRPPRLDLVVLEPPEVMGPSYPPRKPTEIFVAHPSAPAIERGPVPVSGSRGEGLGSEVTEIFAVHSSEAGPSSSFLRQRKEPVSGALGGARFALDGTEILGAEGRASVMEPVDSIEALDSRGVPPSEATTVLVSTEPGDHFSPPIALATPASATSGPTGPITASLWPPQASYGRLAHDERQVRPAQSTASRLPQQAQYILPTPSTKPTLTIPLTWILIAFGVMIVCGAAVGMWLAR